MGERIVMMEWINCEDQMPPINRWVLVNDPEMVFFDEQIPQLKNEIVRRIRDNSYLTIIGNSTYWKSITHWMPLPEPPALSLEDSKSDS